MLNVKDKIKTALDTITGGLPCTIYNSNADAIANAEKTVSSTGFWGIGDLNTERDYRAKGYDIQTSTVSILLFLKNPTARGVAMTTYVTALSGVLRGAKISGALTSRVSYTYPEQQLTDRISYIEVEVEIKEIITV